MGPRARFWEPFNEDLPPNARIERILNWLDLPVAERPTFLSLYFSDVDGAGHDNGPESRAVAQAVRRVDRLIDRLLRGLASRRIDDRVNVVIVSDHGMSEANTSRVVVLDDYLSLDGWTSSTSIRRWASSRPPVVRRRCIALLPERIRA